MKKLFIFIMLIITVQLFADKSFILYELKDNSTGIYGDKVLFPYFYEFTQKETDMEQYNEIFDFLKLRKSDIYKNTKIINTPESQKKLLSDKTLTIEIDKNSVAKFEELVSEIIYTFTENGVDSFIFINNPVNADKIWIRRDVKFTSFDLKIDMWRVLPPQRLSNCFVVLPNTMLNSCTTFYNKIDKNDKKIIEFILNYIKTGNKFQKINAMKSLSYLKVKDSEKYIVDSLNDSDVDIVLASLEGLVGNKKNDILKKVSDLLEKSENKQVKLYSAKLLIASEQKDFVLKGLNFFLGYDDIDKKIEIIKSIATYKNSEDMIIMMLKDNNEKIRLTSLEYLKSAKKNPSFDAIKACLSDTSDKVRLLASNILVTNPNYKRFGLYHQITVNDEVTATNAAMGLFPFKSEETSLNLIKCFEQKNNKVVHTCATILLKHKDKTAIIPFFKYFDKNVSDEGIGIAKDFVSFYDDKELVANLKENIESLQKELIILLGYRFKDKKDAATVAAIVPFLKSNNEFVRIESIIAIDKIKAPEGLKSILEIAGDSALNVRMTILNIIDNYKADEVKDTLLKYVDDTNDDLRVITFKKLMKFNIKEALPRLEQYSTSSVRKVKISALEALITLSDKIPQEMEDKFQSLLEQDDPEIKMWAIYGLSKTLKRTTLPFITIHGQDTDAKVRKAVVFAIGELDYSEKTKIDMVYAGSEDVDTDVKKEAAIALGKIGKQVDIEKIKNLISKETNEDIKKLLKESLSAIEERNKQD